MRVLCTLSTLALAVGCGGPPQQKDEARVVYRASFSAEEGVSTKVVFPFPNDGVQLEVEQGLEVTGGTARLEAAPEGNGLAVEGRGTVTASFSRERLAGLGESGVPEASLTRPVPDGGVGDRYLKVNKGGSALVPIEFEYTAARDCGEKCGGTRSWKYQGPVGLSLQEVQMTFTEERRQ